MSNPDRVSPAAAVPAIEAIVDRLPPRLRGVTEWLLSRWPGRFAMRTAASCIRIELFDRSMAIAAQIFTSVFPILIALSTWFGPDSSDVASVMGVPDETASVVNEAVGGTPEATFGIIGVLIVLISATSLSRALTRAFAAIWELPRPKTKLNAAWRWFAVVLALALSLVVIHRLADAAQVLEPPDFWTIVISFAGDVAVVGVFVPWMLLQGTVRPRLLLPGALLYATVMLAVRPASQFWLPIALESSAEHYGAIGVAFTYLAWLYIVAFCFLAASVVGEVITTDDSAVGRWIRGRKPTTPTSGEAADALAEQHDPDHEQ